MRLLALVLAALLAASCAWTYPPRDKLGTNREREHPTRDHLAALMVVPAPVDYRSVPFSISVYPPRLLSGGAVWITCHVPTSLRAPMVRVALEGKRASWRPNDRIQQRLLIDPVPCGTWVASCILSTGEVRTAELEVSGAAC